jgi:hypothetical protein
MSKDAIRMGKPWKQRGDRLILRRTGTKRNDPQVLIRMKRGNMNGPLIDLESALFSPVRPNPAGTGEWHPLGPPVSELRCLTAVQRLMM